MSHPIQTIQFQDLNAQINLAERSKKDLIEFLNVSKGKILTLIKTVFSFLNDKSLLKNESHSSFMKYTIESKLVQTMNKVYNFYTANFPENGRETLHDLIKERYLKFIKFYEQNNIFFVNSTELEYKFYLIQAMILLWLIEIKYDTEYYDEIIRVINGLVRLSQKDKNNIITNSSSKSEKNHYLLDFLNIIMKFPYIKQNKEIIIHALEVNECSETLIEVFNNNLINLIKNRNSSFHQRQTISSSEQNEDKSDINFGKKSISSSKEDSYFSLIKENKKEKEKEKTVTSSSISNKRKSFSNASSHKGILSSINSSGFYTPEFKHAKRGSIRNFRRFTINNINNPRTSISNKNNSLSRSLSTGMNNLLNKCEEGINHNNNINNLNNNNLNNNGQSTKSKLRLAVQGHFYTCEEDNKNNLHINNNINSINNKEENSSKNFSDNINNNSLNNSLSNELISENNDNIIDACDAEEDIENNVVSVDELPINPNLSMISNSNSKNIGVEPENIIQETKEEEENDDNDNTNDKNAINKIESNNNFVKILSDNEIKEFFSQQFSDKKNKEKNNDNINNSSSNNLNINSNLFNEKKNKNKNKKRNTSSDSLKTLNNNNKSKKNIKNINSKKIKKAKSKSRSKSKENNLISKGDKMKNYSQNIFGMIKNNKSHKNNKKENILKNKNENTILEPCTKGKEMMNNIINNLGSKKSCDKEPLPTDSHAKKNLFSLYNQMKAKK